MPRNENVGVGVAVILFREGDGKVPMSRRLMDRETWQWPGGWVDDGESPVTAAARELQEEAGIEIMEDDLVLIMADAVASVMYPGTWVITLFYTACLPAGVVMQRAEPDKSGPWEFFAPDDLPSPQFYPNYADALRAATNAY